MVGYAFRRRFTPVLKITGQWRGRVREHHTLKNTKVRIRYNIVFVAVKMTRDERTRDPNHLVRSFSDGSAFVLGRYRASRLLSRLNQVHRRAGRREGRAGPTREDLRPKIKTISSSQPVGIRSGKVYAQAALGNDKKKHRAPCAHKAHREKPVLGLKTQHSSSSQLARRKVLTPCRLRNDTTLKDERTYRHKMPEKVKRTQETFGSRSLHTLSFGVYIPGPKTFCPLGH